MAQSRRLGFLFGEAQGKAPRGFVAQGRFIDIGWIDPGRRNADLGQKVQPSRAGAGQNQAHQAITYLKR